MILRYFPGMALMALLVLLSNILVQFLVGKWLTWGAFTYPFAFLITDIMNRLYGPVAARKVVFVGFFTGIACSFIGTQIIGAYGPLVTLRIAIGSGIAFLTAQLLDIHIFDRLRRQKWWRAPLASSVIGSSVDSLIFFFIAFSASIAFIEPGNDVSWANTSEAILGIGPPAPYWVSLALADWAVKMLVALAALYPFRIATNVLWVRRDIANP